MILRATSSGVSGRKHQIVDHTGIVDRNIDPAEPRQGPFHKPFGKLRVADVSGAGLALAAQSGCQRLKRIGIEIAQHQTRASPGKIPRCRLAKAAGRTGQEDNPVGETPPLFMPFR